MAIDPSCGMPVDEMSGLHTERNGATYWFCCDHCRQNFLATSANVNRWAGSGDCCQPASTAQKQGTRSVAKADSSAGDRPYTCPMHPEIQRNHHGTCPKCGMALALKTLSVGSQ